jgi:hypothetical protein
MCAYTPPYGNNLCKTLSWRLLDPVNTKIWFKRIHSQHRLKTGSVRSSPRQATTPAAQPGAEHLGTWSITISQTHLRPHAQVPLLRLLRHT